jgi:hypothetical protein
MAMEVVVEVVVVGLVVVAVLAKEQVVVAQVHIYHLYTLLSHLMEEMVLNQAHYQHLLEVAHRHFGFPLMVLLAMMVWSSLDITL